VTEEEKDKELTEIPEGQETDKLNLYNVLHLKIVS
jgi:hypothetical protein